MNDYEVRGQPDTFLSPLVRKLLVEIGNTFQQNTITSRLYLTPTLTFNWIEIQKLIGELSDCFNIHIQQSEWFSTIIHKVWPVFAEANQTLRNSSPDELEHLWNLCKWTRKEMEIQQFFSYFISGFPTSTIEAVLFLTVILERSLGNVFLLKGNNVPFLLRDLLSTEELRSILGTIPTVFIQVLQGTPQALNLRNIVWHGFPTPEEIKPEFGATLFIIIGSIGEILSQMHIDINSLPCRPQVSNLIYHSHMLEGCFLQLNMGHKDAIKTILFNSPHIAKSHQIYWDKLLEYYYKGGYGECVLLLLPQMEHMLRSVFCWLNKCPERVLTAESTSFYTTLDEILLENVNDKPNQIRTVLGNNLIVMLQDIFVHHKGPRIRDKVSHGECELSEIPQILINHIICVALAIVLRLSVEDNSLKKQEDASRNNITSYLSAVGCTNEIIDLDVRLREACEKYESRFHSSSLLKTAIVSATEELTKWKECPRPEKIEEFEFRTWEEAQQDDKTEIPHLKQELWSVLQRTFNLNDSDYENHFYDSINNALKNKISTLYRPKIESEMLNILQQIADNINVICVQVQDGLKYRFNMFSSRLLRSRQRETYQRMLKAVPCLYSVVQYMILLLVTHLLSINRLSSVSNKDLQYLQRYLKQVLQYVQNVTTYTSTEKNRWDELQSATFSFSQQMLQYSKQNYILNTAKTIE